MLATAEPAAGLLANLAGTEERSMRIVGGRLRARETAFCACPGWKAQAATH